MEEVDSIRYFTFRKLKYIWRSAVEEWISPADLDGQVGRLNSFSLLFLFSFLGLRFFLFLFSKLEVECLYVSSAQNSVQCVTEAVSKAGCFLLESALPC